MYNPPLEECGEKPRILRKMASGYANLMWSRQPAVPNKEEKAK